MTGCLLQTGIWRSRSRAAPAGGRLPLRGRWTGRSPGRMRGTQPSRRTGPDEWGLPGRSLSQPTADCSLYEREPLYRPQSEMFIGARLFSVVGAPHPSGLTPCHLPRRGRRPPAGVWDTGRSGKSEVFSLIRQGFALPPSPWGKASSGGGLGCRGTPRGAAGAAFLWPSHENPTGKEKRLSGGISFYFSANSGVDR